MNPIFFRLAEIATDLDNEFPEEAKQLDQALDALGDEEEQPNPPAPQKAPLPPQAITPSSVDQVPPAGMDQPEPAAESQPETFSADESAETETSPADAKADEEAQIEESTKATAAPVADADASYAPGDVESAIDGLADLIATQLEAEGWNLGMPETIAEFQRRIKKQLEDASMY